MLIQLFKKYKRIILYVFFGGCTTLVNMAAYYVCTRIFQMHLLAATVVAWLLAVLFAYVTNRNYVFMSENRNAKAIMLEFVSFISCRLLTGFLDLGNMYVFVSLLKLNDLFIKLASNVMVIVGNYVASRVFIFKKHFEDTGA